MLILALIAALSCLPFYVFAQSGNAVVKSQKSVPYTAFTDGGGFVVYQGPNGDTVCRDATLAESRALRGGTNDYGLHQINHLTDGAPGKNAVNQAPPTLTIVLRATAQLDANPTAKAAFIAAAAKWEALIKDPITIIIDVDFGTSFFGQPFGSPLILGATSTQLFASDYSDFRGRLISHANGAQEMALTAALPTGSIPTDLGNSTDLVSASPIYRALGFFPADATTDTTTPGNPPRIGFNSAFNFDFNPNDGITGNRTDFDAVAVHEMGHALGFTSEVGDSELSPGGPLYASMWDIFRFRPGTANLNTFATAPRILSSGGEQVHFSGGAELGLSTGRPDGNGGDGEQASHWKADEQSGIYVGIMDPTIQRNVREVMTLNDEAAIDAFGYTITATTGPPNDNFGNAQVISGGTGTVSGNNNFATRETGEPTNPVGTGGGRSVWYSWTAGGTGQATFDTDGSDYDTILAVYTGTAVNALTVLASNDDIDPPNAPEPRNINSIVTFNVTTGTTYRIQVDGFNGGQGSITLHWVAPGGSPTPSPTPNTVQFTASTASVGEALIAPNTAAQVDLLVTRTGTTTAAASVKYATSDATASDRSDYEAAAGTLQFAAGETSKTISVFIVDDSHGEGAETFNVTLSGPVSCTLGSPAAVAVTINSNESVSGTNPVTNGTFNNEFFVRQHYLDFFNRAPDVDGLAFWKNQLDDCETRPPVEQQPCREIRRINVSAAFFLSIEYQQTGYLVERLYKTAYGNATGTSTLGGTHPLTVPIVRLNEFLPDTQAIGKGVIIGAPGADQLLENNKQALIADFVQRSRFVTAFPVSMTPTQFVTALNTNAGGVLSTAEFNQLVSDLTSSPKTRAQVLRAVAEDSDLFAAESNQAFVLTQFFGYLRRNPNDTPDSDYTGYDFWLGKLNQFNGNFVNAEMVKAFILSGEYQGRFGP